ncbi:PhaM family polyhydroxyalkanoate granule multifunctional regulatory protein [Ramlibacter sp. AN1133]|uniref:PhaM family polyhydroxyalkanoate granule multifunctional regulatory protein n=1 Tax=Ramlibacter sp. AN1133 TaxID=3133429 RepID=UPI0030C347B7
MSDNGNFGFAKLVPGFDFLQNLAKGASQSIPQMPHLSNWVAPTLNVEELEKRIAELKAVQFWLEQNGRALSATIQALEVQKMTLATLEGMNFSMGELANSLKLKTTETMASGARRMGEAAEAAASAVTGAADAVAGVARRKPAGRKADEEENLEKGEPGEAAKPAGGGAPIDPLQWWGALTHQFQQIAANAMKDAAQKTASDTARNMAGGAAKAAAGMAKAAVKAPASTRTAAKKSTARKGAARKTRAKKAADKAPDKSAA